MNHCRHNLLFALIALLVWLCGSPLAAQEAPAEEAASEAPASEDAEAGQAETAPEEGTVAAAPAPAPEPDADAQPTSIEAMLEAENTERARVNRIGMGILGGWALGNITWGTIGLLTTSENPQRSFHMTNAAWNLVNGLIATVGYFSNTGEGAGELNLVETVSASHNIEKVLLFNAGLDAAYIAGGAYLIARGLDEQKDGLIGTGRSVILQGAFLLVFDAAMYTVHLLRRKKFQSAIGELQ